MGLGICPQGPIQNTEPLTWAPSQAPGLTSKSDYAQDITSHLVYFRGDIYASPPNCQHIAGGIQLAPTGPQFPFCETAGIPARRTELEFPSRNTAEIHRTVNTSQAVNVPLHPAVPTVISATKRASPRRPSPNLKRTHAEQFDTRGSRCLSKSKLRLPNWRNNAASAAARLSGAATQSWPLQRNWPHKSRSVEKASLRLPPLSDLKEGLSSCTLTGDHVDMEE